MHPQLSAFPAGLGRPEAGAGYPEVVAGYPEVGAGYPGAVAGYPGAGAGYHGRRALEVPYALPSFTHSWDETAEYPPPSSRHPPRPLRKYSLFCWLLSNLPLPLLCGGKRWAVVEVEVVHRH